MCLKNIINIYNALHYLFCWMKTENSKHKFSLGVLVWILTSENVLLLPTLILRPEHIYEHVAAATKNAHIFVITASIKFVRDLSFDSKNLCQIFNWKIVLCHCNNSNKTIYKTKSGVFAICVNIWVSNIFCMNIL